LANSLALSPLRAATAAHSKYSEEKSWLLEEISFQNAWGCKEYLLNIYILA
jgi:hypothetical protein